MSRPIILLVAATLAFSSAGCSIVSSLLNLAIPIGMAKLPLACLPEGTLIDTPTGPRAIEVIETGDAVIGFTGETVQVLQKHSYLENPVVTQFFKVGFDGGASVDLCGMHRIENVRAKYLAVGDVVDGDRVASITTYTGVERSYDLLTEDNGYRIGGVPVNSMIEEMASARQRDIDEARR